MDILNVLFEKSSIKICINNTKKKLNISAGPFTFEEKQEFYIQVTLVILCSICGVGRVTSQQDIRGSSLTVTLRPRALSTPITP